ncbi:hypothetical protein [Streptomyces viridochromogenes]|uniref:hypothetical protein n=1 Tax=Streptomyces viridochromogenes TaxID=1938 RepID=UPI000304EE80|nr:hypothetical protein [Streptomyces viridochromogenes]
MLRVLDDDEWCRGEQLGDVVGVGRAPEGLGLVAPTKTRSAGRARIRNAVAASTPGRRSTGSASVPVRRNVVAWE